MLSFHFIPIARKNQWVIQLCNTINIRCVVLELYLKKIRLELWGLLCDGFVFYQIANLVAVKKRKHKN